ncbi:tetratricopeptide repeat protein [Dethiobacter alkaliphilus]|uniref:tetratricopeptide repeat protein n=1 Tax=Dethiobacter alkaliphilus TaxID=427926 RepID=UPI002227DF4A|nr:tetratricopeptide repeat protein [Dethiobacter alkaliphilus]MCW3488721.1 tetratricopeptide repeat protein [Dethiobacter alkaliphilus]
MRFAPNNHKKNAAADYNRQGALLMPCGAYRQASYYFLSAVVCDPDYWPAFFNLGNCWARLEENEAAIWAYEQAVRNCDHHAPLFSNLGIVLCRQGEAKRALPYLEQALRLNPDSPSCAAVLGYVCFQLEQWGLAWHWYRRALQLEPDNDSVKDSLKVVSKKISVAVQ